MLVSVIPIGNSRGIRIPKNILQQLGIGKKVELEVREEEILIRPVKKKTREGWAEKFAEMHEKGEDELLIDIPDEEDDFQWEW